MQVKDFLTHPRFVLVDNREDADILWLMEHFKDFRLVAVRNVPHFPVHDMTLNGTLYKGRISPLSMIGRFLVDSVNCARVPLSWTESTLRQA